jgi:hypothetical protein
MIPPFDIFRCEADESLLWISAASDLESAKAKIRQLMQENPSDYILFSLTTQNKRRFKKGDEIV